MDREPRPRPIDKLRYLVAIEFPSQDKAIDHMVDLMTSSWKGPKQENLKLIVIKHSMNNQITGLEVGPEQLKQLNQLIAKA